MKRLTILTTLLLLLGAGSVSAQQRGLGFRGWGPRLGLTVDPDQVHFGVHADFGDFTQRFRFQPNIEMGVGDGYTTAAFNLEGSYRFRNQWDVWSPYVGGGLGVMYWDRNDDFPPPRGSNAESAVSILVGIEKPISERDRVFFETKVGLVDAPDLRLTLGWIFGH